MPEKPDRPHATHDLLDDPDAPPTAEELAEADRLRAALEGSGGRGPAGESAELARALGAAWSPRDLTGAEHQALIDRALASSVGARRRRRVIRGSFAAGAVVALAAGVLLVFSSGAIVERPSATIQRPPAASAGLAVTRSTQPLFRDPFAVSGGVTARIDRIAMARAADLRDNEFAKWGVR